MNLPDDHIDRDRILGGPDKADAAPAPRPEDILPGGRDDEPDTNGSSAAESDEHPDKDWYILKVASNRENSIADALERRVKILGLEQYVERILVPVERVREINPRTHKQRIVKRKLYPGYIVVHMEINEDTWFLIRETPGVGDFTGSGGKPVALQPHEVNRLLDLDKPLEEDPGKQDEGIKLNIKFKLGDRVRVTAGNFEGFEGEVLKIDERSGRVTVELNVLGQRTPVEFDYTVLTPL